MSKYSFKWKKQAPKCHVYIMLVFTIKTNKILYKSTHTVDYL